MSGGGVYGAFQAGALHALYEEGVRFVSIAGTSAGALNAVLASSGQAGPLSYWNNIPAALARETELAEVQWRQALRVFSRAEAIGHHAGIEYLEERTAAGAGGGGVLGGIVGGVLRGTWGGGLVGAAIGGAFGGAAALLTGGEEAERTGRRAALRYLNSVLDEFGEGSLLSVRAADALRSVARSARLKTPVRVTVSTLKRFRGGHLLRIKETQSSEVSPQGQYLSASQGELPDQVVASMALPIMMGRRNAVNPTDFLDGGLFDNVPIEALAPEIDSGAIDCIFVIDVSQSGTFSWSWGKKGIPVLCLSLSRSDRAEEADEFLDFSKAPFLFRLGRKFGGMALKRWFRNDRFDPRASEAGKTMSLYSLLFALPQDHIIRASV
jgi:predicted acylesterase/phospholipase RssA